MKALVAQVRIELTLMMRRGESLLINLLIPVGFLLFFSTTKVLPSTAKHPIDFLAPAILILAVISTSMVSLGIATGFERSYGVLKRFQATPLGVFRLLSAKIITTLTIELLQLIILIPIALGLGWHPELSSWQGFGDVAVVLILGTIVFTGIGLLMAGTLKAEINLAACNGLYFVFLLLGGIMIPVQKLPDAIQPFSKLLPSYQLVQLLVTVLTKSRIAWETQWIVLILWAIIIPIVAVRTWSWE
ncbi:MAG: ABC transporter permease [Actinobacteria bacterium]|jgi:ABC-2 type transport system permease protein|nr:ABC transporter permease [Actinomycetota bacterium]MCL6105646.1 ABC transporter permease [Actinomycetota bacterium]